MDNKIELKVNLGIEADQPTVNGRIYSKELLKKICENANEKHLPVYFGENRTDIIGEVKDIDNETLTATISIHDNDISRVIIDHIKDSLEIVPRGVGKIDKDGKIYDYSIIGTDLIPNYSKEEN